MKHLCFVYILLLVSIIGGCCSSKTAQTMSGPPMSHVDTDYYQDSLVAKVLGDTIVNVLFAPDSVSACKLSETIITSQLKQSKSYQPQLPHKKVEEKQLKLLQLGFLSNQKNYHCDSIMVMSPYIPAMELVFYKNNEIVNMIISFSDHSWNIEKGGKDVLHYNYVTVEPLTNIFNDL